MVQSIFLVLLYCIKQVGLLVSGSIGDKSLIIFLRKAISYYGLFRTPFDIKIIQRYISISLLTVVFILYPWSLHVKWPLLPFHKSNPMILFNITLVSLIFLNQPNRWYFWLLFLLRVHLVFSDLIIFANCEVSMIVSWWKVPCWNLLPLIVIKRLLCVVFG